MKKLLAIAAAVAAFGIINVAAIADTTPAPAPASPAPTAPVKPLDLFHGKVSAVDATAKTITIDSKKVGSKTFTLTATTEIKLDGKPATLADIVVGDKAAVKFDGTTALKLHAKTASATTGAAKGADKPVSAPGAPTF